jgi:hypothetical protein
MKTFIIFNLTMLVLLLALLASAQGILALKAGIVRTIIEP